MAESEEKKTVGELLKEFMSTTDEKLDSLTQAITSLQTPTEPEKPSEPEKPETPSESETPSEPEKPKQTEEEELNDIMKQIL